MKIPTAEALARFPAGFRLHNKGCYVEYYIDHRMKAEHQLPPAMKAFLMHISWEKMNKIVFSGSCAQPYQWQILEDLVALFGFDVRFACIDQQGTHKTYTYTLSGSQYNQLNAFIAARQMQNARENLEIEIRECLATSQMDSGLVYEDTLGVLIKVARDWIREAEKDEACWA